MTICMGEAEEVVREAMALQDSSVKGQQKLIFRKDLAEELELLFRARPNVGVLFRKDRSGIIGFMHGIDLGYFMDSHFSA